MPTKRFIRNRFAIRTALSALILVALTITSAATPITINFHGIVTEIVNYSGLIGSDCPTCAVPLGTEVSGSYTFTANPGNLAQVLPGAVIEFSAGSLDRTLVGNSAAGIGNLTIEIPYVPLGDAYRAMVQQEYPDPYGSGLAVEQFGLDLATAAVPLLPADVSQIPTLGAGYFFFHFLSNYSTIEFNGALDQIGVPISEPASLSLLAAGLLSFGVILHRRRQGVV